MNRIVLLIFLGFWFLFHSLYGRGANSTNSIPEKQYSTSDFSSNGAGIFKFELQRDPFWPVGYEPGAPLAESEPEKIGVPEPTARRIPWPELRVLGFIQSKKNEMALLEKIGLVQAGDIVSRKVGDMLFEWKITKIARERVRYERIGHRRLEKSE